MIDRGKKTTLASLTGFAFLAGGLMLAAPATAERLTVPLSDPSKPAKIEVGLVSGSIRVKGGATREVVIEARSGDEGELKHERGDEGEGRRGMRRIPNTALGLSAEEEDNVVSISAESWNREIELTIEVPADSRLELSTVNGGDIEVEGVNGELDLHNTNGEIHVKDVKGPVSATTVNGDVSVVFTSAMVAAPMAFSTLNGDVDVTLPASLKADVRLRSDNGEIYSDFDIAMNTVKPDVEEKREGGKYRLVVSREMTGKISGGGPELFLKTFNGDILLRRKG
jgi:DUF4097 and DUF4098 domain-containing protein YvlB